MALSLLSNQTAIKRSLSIPFKGVGGVEPYVYSVDAGGVGGTIDSASGLYTSPSSGLGVDVVRVIDSDGASFTRVIFVGGYLELFCEIIRRELNLADDQVYIYNQKIKPPKDSRMYVAVGVLSSKPFGVTKRLRTVAGLEEVQAINVFDTISIDIMSRSTEALERKHEIVMAFTSNYSQVQQETNSFLIARLASSITNLSEEESAAIPYRFNISVNMQYSLKKEKEISYFDSFEDPSIITDP